MLFNLDNVSQVALEDMNEVHSEELIMVNNIYRYLTTNEDLDHQIIEKMLQEFAFHLRDHFLFEEDMMRQTNCPILGCHEGEHKRVQKIMFQIFTEYGVSKNINLLKFYFEIEFKSWIENHILTMDTVTGIFLKDYYLKN